MKRRYTLEYADLVMIALIAIILSLLIMSGCQYAQPAIDAGKEKTRDAVNDADNQKVVIDKINEVLK